MQMTVELPDALYRRAVAMSRGRKGRGTLVLEALREYVGRRTRVLAARRDLARALARRGVTSLAKLERLDDAGRA